MQVLPYLYFDGRCDEALAFYQKHLGATVESLMRFKDAPPSPAGGCTGPMPPADKVMHASFKIGGSTLMASDGNSLGKPQFQGISLSLVVRTAEEAERVWAALAEGGQVQMPLGETFFSPRFGMVADRFGVSWMVVVMH
jgi:PhnB protein